MAPARRAMGGAAKKPAADLMRAAVAELLVHELEGVDAHLRVLADDGLGQHERARALVAVEARGLRAILDEAAVSGAGRTPGRSRRR